MCIDYFLLWYIRLRSATSLPKDVYKRQRYNKDFSISQEQLEYLISRVDILKDITERLCKEKIAEYDTMPE